MQMNIAVITFELLLHLLSTHINAIENSGTASLLGQ